VFEALVKADFHALHIPEAYGGAGGDALAAAIVIEEVARGLRHLVTDSHYSWLLSALPE
jgi:alkylation response protein AidB-like acyl-CoA dehydrogenase